MKIVPDYMKRAYWWLVALLRTRIPDPSPATTLKLGTLLMVAGMLVFYTGSCFIGLDRTYSFWGCFGGVMTMFGGIALFSWSLFKFDI